MQEDARIHTHTHTCCDTSHVSHFVNPSVSRLHPFDATNLRPHFCWTHVKHLMYWAWAVRLAMGGDDRRDFPLRTMVPNIQLDL